MTKQTVFISYRRSTGSLLARTIYEMLVELKIDAFFDVETLRAGDFFNEIKKHIINRDIFMLILTEEALDSEWVRKELEIAREFKKQIILIVNAGFDFDSNIPDDLKWVGTYNAITYNYRYPENTLTELKKFLISRQNSTPMWLGITIIALVVVLIGFGIVNWQGSSNQGLNEGANNTQAIESNTVSEDCEARIVFTTGASIAEVRLLAQSNAMRAPAIRQGETVVITNQTTTDGELWYYILYGDGNAGWIPEEFVVVNTNC